MKLNKILPILRCPQSGTCLHQDGNELVSETGERYPIVNGKPILVKQLESFHVEPPSNSVISQNIREYVLSPAIAEIPGFKIHIGSGNVPCSDPAVISIDILPNDNVDLVAEAEHLPFANDSVVWAESGAVFEHLYNPLAAIEEVRRVLAPGRSFYIDTAFMQGYHGFPCHYFNMTPQAVETFIVDDFELELSQIPASGSPAISLENQLRRFIDALPKQQRLRLLSMTTMQLLAELSDPAQQQYMFDMMSEHIRRSLAASTCVIARKPMDYATRKRRAETVLDASKFAALRRRYYAVRVGVMERYNEIEHYRRRVLEVDEQRIGAVPTASLEELLSSAKVKDTLAVAEWEGGCAALQLIDESLTAMRDEWIKHYLSSPIPTDNMEIQRLEKSSAESLRLEEARLIAESAEAQAQEALEAVLNSTSWRVTAPMRRFITAIRRRFRY